MDGASGTTREGAIPSGVVTFLFTDIEGSTRWWVADPDGMAESLRRHDEVVRREIERHAGFVFATGGDGFCAAFGRPSEALSAAEAVQSRLDAVDWPGPELRVRIGVHLGEADERGGDYFGTPVITAARVASAGHGGQVLVTETVRSSAGVDAIDLGPHVLRDVPEPVHVWQLGDGEFPPLRTSTARSNVPSPPTRLLGRDDDVRAVRLMLAEHRLVTLVAIGGTGKTRLAIAVAEAELAHWRDGVWFVDLAGAAGGADVLHAVAKAIGFEAPSEDRGHAIPGYLAARQSLLVLDNCEHVLDACADLAASVLIAGGRSKVLATSRVWLDIDGERVYHVAPLGTDGPRSPAAKLFADRAVAVAPGFALDDGNTADVSELCRRLDGVPLAIELAASRAGVMTPAQLLGGLDDRFRTLSGGRWRRRQGTLEATVRWSYDQLEADEQRVFRALGVLAGSFDIGAIAAVCELSVPDATDVVEVLYARSLVVSSRESRSRFRLLETLKAYAERQLVEAGEVEVVRERHCMHFTGAARADTLLEAWRLERCIGLLPDVANLLLAADWLETHRRWDDLAEHLFGVAFVSGDEAASMLERLARCRRHLVRQEAIDAVDHAAIFCTMALADWMAYIDATARLRTSPNRPTAAFGYLYLALVTARHAPGEAHSMIDRFADLAGDDAAGDNRDHATFWRSMVEAMSGDLVAAARLATEVIDRPVGRTSLALNARMIAAVAAWTNDEPGPLVALADELETAHRSTGRLDPYYQSVVGFARALVALKSDELDVAEAVVRDQACDAASGRVTLVDGDALGLLAELARRSGDVDRARELIMKTGPGRSPATVGFMRWVAGQLGLGGQLQEAYCRNMFDLAWMVDRPRTALRRELERRSWCSD